MDELLRSKALDYTQLNQSIIQLIEFVYSAFQGHRHSQNFLIKPYDLK